MTDRGGKGGTSVLKNGKLASIRPETDGKGCPWCGAVRGGGHGGNCPNAHMRFDEDGRVISSESWNEQEAGNS